MVKPREALKEVQDWTEGVGLTLHPVKRRIVDATQAGGFDFLGYHFERGYRWPPPKSLDKFKDTIRAKTWRCNGQSLQATITDLNRTLKGWFEYFQHSHHFTFTALDKWGRMRRRSILRRPQGRRGRKQGPDRHRWPNAFFAALGLFSLMDAHTLACQSRRGG